MRATRILPGLVVLACGCSAVEAPTSVPLPDASSAMVLSRTDLGTLGGTSSYAADVNDLGVVVGSSQTAGGATHAFRWSQTTGMIDLGTLPGDVESRAVAILDDGLLNGAEILGFSGTNGHWTPVVWTPTGISRTLNIPLLPDATFGAPTGFNTLGQVIGYDAVNLQHAWVWSATAGKYDLTANAPGGSREGSAMAINTSGFVLLTTRANSCASVTECWRTYLWSPRLGYLDLGTPTNDADVAVTGLGMSETGLVTGWVQSAHSSTTAYRWNAATGFTLLPHYSDDAFATGYGTAVNARGTVVGAERDPLGGNYVASAWPAAGGIVRLSPEDPNPGVAVAINASNVIAGWTAISDQANHAVIWRPVSDLLAAAVSTARSARVSPSAPSAACLPRAAASRSQLVACALGGTDIR